jgi:hypothetical protein
MYHIVHIRSQKVMAVCRDLRRAARFIGRLESGKRKTWDYEYRRA